MKADPLISSASYTDERILKDLIPYVINRESCRHLCLPTVHTYFKCWVTFVNRHMATGWGTPCTSSEGTHNRCNKAYKNYFSFRTRVCWSMTSCWWANCYPRFRRGCCFHVDVQIFIYFLINTAFIFQTVWWVNAAMETSHLIQLPMSFIEVCFLSLIYLCR
jgi:hypothetical protein